MFSWWFLSAVWGPHSFFNAQDVHINTRCWCGYHDFLRWAGSRAPFRDTGVWNLTLVWLHVFIWSAWSGHYQSSSGDAQRLNNTVFVITVVLLFSRTTTSFTRKIGWNDPLKINDRAACVAVKSLSPAQKHFRRSTLEEEGRHHEWLAWCWHW